ncbi:ParA family protein [Candidatus Palauibacter sp.]|uniref:ParA family protein n=1 Tax=Candidatus Palauibacter sp. TaxID=3101350 RepID=UPI003AF24144
MNVPALTFFNNKGGVGKTSLVYHLAWMLSELDRSVLAVDLDPQANLTAAFLSEGDVERLWESSADKADTIA